MSVPKKILVDINVLERLIKGHATDDVGDDEYVEMEVRNQLMDGIERARKTR